MFGVEAQGDWANLKGSSPSATAIIPFDNQTRIDGIGLFTGQAGYAWSNILLYVKGGAAVTDNRYSNVFTVNNAFGNAGTVFNSASDPRWGGTVGAGFEIGLAPNWSVAVEYDHLFMGNRTITFAATAIAVSRADNIRQDVDMATVRVNYRWAVRSSRSTDDRRSFAKGPRPLSGLFVASGPFRLSAASFGVMQTTSLKSEACWNRRQ